MRQGAIVSVHVGRRRPRGAGLVFAKPLLPIGGARSGGFGPGLPPLGDRVTLAVWEDLAAYERALAGGWSVALEALSARGSHRGRRPIAPTGEPLDGAPMAAVTLGRATPRTLLRFLRRGAALAAPTRDAPGLITALSAGVPLTGNLTFSVWESEQRMLDFAYGRDAAHRGTVRERPPILVEQLTARLRVLRVDGGAPRWALHPKRLSRFAAGLRTGPRV
jgi:hypothetical protein